MSDENEDRGASVLLAFRARNVRSYRDEVELSLLASSLARRAVVREVPWRVGGRPIGVLPAAAVFGANASGKSNLLKVMGDMRAHVLRSFRASDPLGGIDRRPFVLDPASSAEPSSYEVDLVLDGVRHEYGFVIDDERVLEEWAYYYPNGKAALIFRRNRDDVDLGSADRAKGRSVTELLRPNALFLSTAAQANHRTLLSLYEWFARNLRLAEAASRPSRQVFTTGMLNDHAHRERVRALLQAADLGISDARRHDLEPVMKERLQRVVRILNGTEGDPDGGDDGPSFEELGVRLVHRGERGEVEFDPDDESLGTLVWFGLVGPIVDSLVNGSVLLADEIDASLHPALVAEVVRMYQDPQSNPHRAQLIFNSHDASLLGDATAEPLLGRDQVWFSEKRNDGSTRLYPLSDLSPRKQEAIGRRYLAGRYGATPLLSSGEFDAAIAAVPSGEQV